MLVHHKVPPPSILSIFVLCEASQTIHRYPLILLGIEKHDERKCLAQEHKTLTWPGLEPRPQNLESSALTIRPPHQIAKIEQPPHRLGLNTMLDSSPTTVTWFLQSQRNEKENHIKQKCFSSSSSGAFLIPYFISVILLGIPLLFLELAIGQSLRQGPIGVWKAIHPYLSGVGLASAVVCVLISMYYNVIIGWCFYYLFASFQDPLPYSFCPAGPNCTVNEECKLAGRTQYYWYTKTLGATTSIEDMGDFQWHLCLVLCLAWIVLLIIINRGVQSAGKVEPCNSLNKVTSFAHNNFLVISLGSSQSLGIYFDY